LTSQAVDSVDSHKKRACPHYPQPYDDGDDAPLLWVGALGTLPEENHNKHSLKWYSFLGELPMILLAVVAASPGTIKEGTCIMPKRANGTIIRYRNPAILAVFLISLVVIVFSPFLEKL